MPFFVSMLLSLSIIGAAYAVSPYKEPIKPSLKGSRLVKDQDRVTNWPWPAKAVPVERITKPVEQKPKKKKRKHRT